MASLKTSADRMRLRGAGSSDLQQNATNPFFLRNLEFNFNIIRHLQPITPRIPFKMRNLPKRTGVGVGGAGSKHAQHYRISRIRPQSSCSKIPAAPIPPPTHIVTIP